MDVQYYRKIKSPRLIRNAFQKFWKRPLLRWSVLLAVPFLFFATFSNKGILQRMKLEGEKKAWQQKVREAEQEQLRLQQLSKALDIDTTSGGTIEHVAREKYGMVREGETLYKVKKK